MDASFWARLSFLLLLTVPAAARADVLRVLTFNAWALPIVSDERERRVQVMGGEIARLKPHVVALQEVWDEADARTIARSLERGGLPHAAWFASTQPAAIGGAGLMIASVYPLDGVTYQPFTMGRLPHTPWHVDWMSRKGVASARVRTPLGDVLIANTHLQANYLTGDYVPVRVGQALELAEALSAEASALPAILAGDLNSPPGDVEFQIVEAGAALAPAADSFDIDAILFRSGKDLALRPTATRSVLVEPVDLGDGTRMELSDHPGVLVEFEMDRVAPSASPPRRWNDVGPRAAGVVRSALASSVSTGRWGAALAAVSVLLAGSFVVAWRRRTRPRVPWRALGAFALLVAGYVSYLAFVYAPDRIAGLERAAKMLDFRDRTAQLAGGSAQ